MPGYATAAVRFPPFPRQRRRTMGRPVFVWASWAILVVAIVIGVASRNRGYNAGYEAPAARRLSARISGGYGGRRIIMAEEAAAGSAADCSEDSSAARWAPGAMNASHRAATNPPTTSRPAGRGSPDSTGDTDYSSTGGDYRSSSSGSDFGGSSDSSTSDPGGGGDDRLRQGRWRRRLRSSGWRFLEAAALTAGGDF